MIQIFILSSLFFDPNFQLQVASSLSKQKRYEESEIVLNNVDYRKLNNPYSYSYFRLLNNFSLNRKIEAQKYVAQLQDYLSTPLPERYKCLSFLMIEDLKTWKDVDLNDVSRDMENVKRRLSNNQGGKNTQKAQREIVSKLDRMIKELEDKKNEAEAKQSAKEAEAQKKQQQEQSGSKAEPQKDSKPGQDVGRDQIDMKKLKELSIEWGKLPPRERESNMRELLRNIPPRYKETIYEYFKKQSKQ